MPSLRDIFKKSSRPDHIQWKVEKNLALSILVLSKIDESPLSEEAKNDVRKAFELKPHFLIIGGDMEWITPRDIRAARKAAEGNPSCHG